MYDWADNLTSSQERVMIEPTSEGCGMNHMIQAKGERRGEGIGIIGGGGGKRGMGEEKREWFSPVRWPTGFCSTVPHTVPSTLPILG